MVNTINHRYPHSNKGDFLYVFFPAFKMNLCIFETKFKICTTFYLIFL